MHSFLYWVDTHQVLSAILLLAIVVVAGRWSSRQVFMKHLRTAGKLLSFPPQSNELNVATAKVGERYAIKVAEKEVFLKVLAIDEANAAFKIQWLSSVYSSGQTGELWANEIGLNSDQMPRLYHNAILARMAMEKKYFVGEGHAHA